MKTASFTHQSVNLTASSLLRICTELSSREKLEITRLPDGKLNFQLIMTTGDKREVTPLINRMERFVSPEPVTPGWMSQINEPDDYQKATRKEHRKEVKAGAKEKANGKDLLKAGLAMILFFKELTDFTRVKRDSGEFLVIDAMGKTIYCNQNKTPVMYQEVGKKEFVYL